MRAVVPMAISVILSCGPSWSIIAPISRLATSRREGVTSLACIDADASSNTTLWAARLALAESAGCTAAATSTPATSSWSSRSQLKRSLCQGTFAWRSRI